MANVLFDWGKRELLEGNIDLLSDTIKLVFVDHTDHAPDPANDHYLSDIDAAARVAISGAFTTKGVYNGVFTADPVTVAAVTGDQFESIVIFQDTGDPATSRLIAYIDTAGGLPCTPDGTNITVTWDTGAEGIFAL